MGICIIQLFSVSHSSFFFFCLSHSLSRCLRTRNREGHQWLRLRVSVSVAPPPAPPPASTQVLMLSAALLYHHAPYPSLLHSSSHANSRLFPLSVRLFAFPFSINRASLHAKLGTLPVTKVEQNGLLVCFSVEFFFFFKVRIPRPERKQDSKTLFL